MIQNTKYEVMKFVEQGDRCYKGSDYIQGQLLAKYVQSNPYLEKAQIFLWITELVKQVEQYHRCKGEQPYQYVNPYMMVISEEGEVRLIDAKASSNASLLTVANKQVIREHFLPEYLYDYSASDVDTDIYGIGKSIQYIFAMTLPNPALTKWEEYVFQKIVRNCLNSEAKQSYETPQDILKHLPKMKREGLTAMRIMRTIKGG